MESPYIQISTKPEDTPLGLFVNAINWDYSGFVLDRDAQRRMDTAKVVGTESGESSVRIRIPTLKPTVVAMVLAVELYVKCLLKSESISFAKVHDLDKLFALVSSSAMKRIEKFYDAVFAEDATLVSLKNKEKAADFSMQGTIKMCSKAFVEWRYYHEGIATAESPIIAPLMNALRMYLVEQNPTWTECLEWQHIGYEELKAKAL